MCERTSCVCLRVWGKVLCMSTCVRESVVYVYVCERKSCFYVWLAICYFGWSEETPPYCWWLKNICLFPGPLVSLALSLALSLSLSLSLSSCFLHLCPVFLFCVFLPLLPWPVWEAGVCVFVSVQREGEREREWEWERERERGSERERENNVCWPAEIGEKVTQAIRCQINNTNLS